MVPRAALWRAAAVGVYQIGDVQARSCTVAGTPPSGAIPCFLAS